MQTMTDLEKTIAGMTTEALAKFRAWFENFDADAWDKQLEKDAAAGKLDHLEKQALEDFKQGRCKEL